MAFAYKSATIEQAAQIYNDMPDQSAYYIPMYLSCSGAAVMSISSSLVAINEKYCPHFKSVGDAITWIDTAGTFSSTITNGPTTTGSFVQT